MKIKAKDLHNIAIMADWWLKEMAERKQLAKLNKRKKREKIERLLQPLQSRNRNHTR